MTRLLSTAYWDIQLQLRNGFYHVTLFMVVFYALLLWQLPNAQTAWFLPALIINNLILNAFYFIGGLLLLEKNEGTLEAQIVTPLRSVEYLLSKVLTLTLLSLAENLALALLLYGARAQLLMLLPGIIGGSVLFALLGFIAVARYDSINEYLLPSIVYVTLFALPLLTYIGVPENALFYLHPLYPSFLLLRAGFQAIESWQLFYALLYGSLWVALLYRWSLRAFHQFVVTKEGVRAA
jgi:fluoroquinolone transport system permease protein